MSSKELHIILKHRNLKICKHSIFSIIYQNMFNGKLKIGFFIDISWRFLKTLFIGLINSDNLLIFKFRNSKLKWYEARQLKKLFRGSNFVQKFGPSKKTASSRTRLKSNDTIKAIEALTKFYSEYDHVTKFWNIFFE